MDHLELETLSAHREWTLDGLPVLEANAQLPHPAQLTSRPEKRLDRFYRLQCRLWFQYCEHFLFPKAAEACRSALDNAQPLPVWKAVLSWNATFNRDSFLSLYIQSRELCGGAPASLLRYADTWWIPKAAPIPIDACFPRHTPVKKILCDAARSEIQRQEQTGIAQYHNDWRRTLRHHWNSRNFYLTDQGLAFFWPMYTIAPAAEGIPTFLLPYGEHGCQLPNLTPLGLP